MICHCCCDCVFKHGFVLVLGWFANVVVFVCLSNVLFNLCVSCCNVVVIVCLKKVLCWF